MKERIKTALVENEVAKKSEYFILPALPQYEALLINVPVDFQQGVKPDGEEPPIGLGRISSYANENQGQSVGIFDVHRARKQDGSSLTLNDIRQILQKSKNSGLRLIGLNPTSVNIEAGIGIASVCDELELPYVLGGYFATLSDHVMITTAFPNALVIVKRDGEIAFTEILKRINHTPIDKCNNIESLRNQLRLSEIRGVYAPNEAEYPNEYADKVPLCELPVVVPSEYYIRPFEIITVNGKQYKESTIFITNGCPYDCAFCASPIMSLRNWGHPGMGRFVDEIQTALTDGAQAIHCIDDLIFTSGKQIEELYEELQKRDLLGKFIWRGMGRANVINRLTDKQLEMLSASGCWQLALGVESGSEKILKEVVHKRLKPTDVISATEKLVKNNIGVKGFFIFGFPGESIEDLRLTYKLATDMATKGARSIAAFEFHPYPGTELYKVIADTMPWIIPQLHYLSVDWSSIGQDDTNGIDKARARAQKTSMWLPDNVRISRMHSKSIRVAVLKTISDFEAIRASNELNKSSIIAV